MTRVLLGDGRVEGTGRRGGCVTTDSETGVSNHKPMGACGHWELEEAGRILPTVAFGAVAQPTPGWPTSELQSCESMSLGCSQPPVGANLP